MSVACITISCFTTFNEKQIQQKNSQVMIVRDFQLNVAHRGGKDDGNSNSDGKIQFNS